MTAGKTLYDKIWDAHLVHEAEDGTCQGALCVRQRKPSLCQIITSPPHLIV